MGLLDDAIREHMELKRLRGADPSVLARQEQDALGPVLREEDAESQAPQAGIANPEEIAAEDAALRGDDSSRASQPARGPDFANVGQETAELDMRTVLDEERIAPEATTATRTAAGPAGDAEEHPGEDSLEWVLLGDSSPNAPEHAESPEGHIIPAAGDAEEPVEDVLEETPDFLRDTPEQERLWFEQQPPRDFDFDK